MEAIMRDKWVVPFVCLHYVLQGKGRERERGRERSMREMALKDCERSERDLLSSIKGGEPWLLTMMELFKLCPAWLRTGMGMSGLIPVTCLQSNAQERLCIPSQDGNWIDGKQHI